MTLFSIDTETELFEPSCHAPRLVCMQVCESGQKPYLVARRDACGHLSGILKKGHELVGQNVPFDFAVLAEEDYRLHEDRNELLSQIFRALDEDRVYDTRFTEQLIDIARGQLVAQRERYSLGTLAKRYLNKELDKDPEGYRLRFGKLMDVPFEQWPERALVYALEDAEVPLKVFQRQLVTIRELYENKGYKEQIAFQTKAAFALQLMRCWGIRTDAEAVKVLRSELEEQLAKDQEELLEEGYLKPKTKGRGKNKHIVGYSRNKASIEKGVQRAYMRLGESYTTTPGGKPRTDRDTLESSGDDVLSKLADRDRFVKTVSFVPVLEKAAQHAWCPSWNVLVSTGRTSCGSDDDPGNLQQPPRKGGIRECVRPRDGHLFVGCDYDTAELRGLSQVCYSWFGHSNMRDAFMAGRDLHSDLAASMLGIDYDEFIKRLKSGDTVAKDARQFAKIPNFGFPGGQGPRSLAGWARKQKAKDLDGNYLTEEGARDLKYLWQRKWREMEDYLDHVASITEDAHGDAVIRQYRSGRVRGGLTFTNCANTFFQGLVADWAKAALFRVSYLCYCEPRSPLYGCRPVIFAHDELILEAPAERASEAAEELRRVMVEEAQKWCDDVPIDATPVLMKVWYKGAEQVRDKHGMIIPWEPAPPKSHPKHDEIKALQKLLYAEGESVHWKVIEAELG